jgi:hypothetical protein
MRVSGSGWIKTFDWALKQDVIYIDGGHYTPTTLENIKDLREYMVDLHDQVLSLVLRGQSWDQLSAMLSSLIR